MDPESSFNLDMRIVAPKSRAQWFSFNEVVDVDRTHFTGLVADVVEKYLHDYGEVASLFYFCREAKVNIQVHSDQDLVDMFAKHRASTTCLLTIVYHSPSSEPPVIPDWDCGSPSTVNPVEPPFTPSIACPNLAEPSHATTAQSAKPEYLANPNPINEHVGVDDEGLYIDLGPNYPPPPPNPQSQGGSKERESESSGADDCSEIDSDDEVEDIDDIVKDREPEQMHDVDYDKKDPSMSVETVYSDMDAFKIA
jgi:hypothetical protein